MFSYCQLILRLPLCYHGSCKVLLLTSYSSQEYPNLCATNRLDFNNDQKIERHVVFEVFTCTVRRKQSLKYVHAALLIATCARNHKNNRITALTRVYCEGNYFCPTVIFGSSDAAQACREIVTKSSPLVADCLKQSRKSPPSNGLWCNLCVNQIGGMVLHLFLYISFHRAT